MRSLWEEFEARETPEAKYAAALDRVQGVLNNFHSGGSSWKAHGVKLSQEWKRIEPVREGTPQLWDFLRGMVQESVLEGWIVDDTR
jgi:putative hydrolases of HD superfamily